MTDINALRIRIRADTAELDRATGSLNRFGQGAERASDSLNRYAASGSRATSVLQSISTLVSGVGVLAMVKLVDSYNSTNALLKVVTSSTQEYTQTQKELFAIAQDNFQSIEATTKQYAGQSKQLQDMGRTHREALEVVDLFGKSLAISGATATESASATLQWTQAISAGVLRGEEFNSIMENGRGVAVALADGLGVSIGGLRQMALEGKLSAKTVVDALLSQGAAIRDRFSQMPLSVDNAWTLVKNSVTAKLAAIDKEFGVTSGIANFLKGISDALDDTNSKFEITNMVIAALGAAAVPVLFTIASALGAATAAAIAFALTPIGAIVVGLTAAVGAIIYLRDEVVTFGNDTASVMDWVIATFQYFHQFITNIGDTLFNDASQSYQKYTALLTDSEPWNILLGYLSALPGYAKQKANGIVAIFVGSVQSIRDGYSILPAALKDLSIQTMNNLIGVFESGVNSIIVGIHNIPVNAIKAFNDLAVKGAQIFDSFVKGLESLPEAFKNIFARAMHKAKALVFEGVNWFIEQFNKIGADIEPLAGVGESVSKSIASISDSIRNGEKITADEVFQIDLGRIENKYEGSAAQLKSVISSNFTEAFKTDYVGEFGNAIGKAFEGIRDEIGTLASDRRLDRMMNEADQSFTELSESSKPVAPAIRKITEASKDAKKAADEMAKSNDKLRDSYAKELIELEKERLQIGKNELQLYQYGLEQERFGKNNLEYSATQIQTLVADKRRNLQLKENEEANKKAADALVSLQKTIVDEANAQRLTHIELTKGTQARYEEELAIKGITGAIADKLALDFADNESLKAKNEAAKKYQELQKSLQQTIIDEANAQRLTLIELTKGTQARYEEELAIKGITGAIADKLALDFADNESLKAKNEAAKKYQELQKSLQQTIIDEANAQRLTHLELTKGTQARYEEELAIKGITGAIADKLALDFAENESLKAKNEATKKHNELRKSAVDEIKKQSQALSFLKLEYTAGADAAFLAEKAVKKYKDAEAESALVISKSIKQYQKMIEQRKAYTDRIKVLSQQSKYNTILLDQGKSAADLYNRTLVYGNEVRATEIGLREKNLELQALEIEGIEKLESVVSDLLHGKIDSISDLGNALVTAFDNDRLDGAIEQLSKKITSILNGGSTKGLGTSVINLFKPTEGSGLISSAFQSYGTGSSLAAMLGADQNTQTGAGLGTMLGNFILPGIGGAIGSVLGGIVGSLFGGKKEQTGSGIALSYSDDGFDGQTYQSFSKKKSFWRGTKRWSDYADFEEDSETALNEYFNSVKETLASQADYLGYSTEKIKGIAISSGDISTVGKTEEEVQQLITDWANDVENALYSSVFGTDLDDLMDAGETLNEALQRTAYQYDVVNRSATLLNLNFSQTGLKALKVSDALVEMMGGLDSFSALTDSYYNNFYSDAEKAQMTNASSAASVLKFNQSIGATGDALIDTEKEFRSYVESLDLTTEAGQQAFTEAMLVQAAMAEIVQSGASLSDVLSNTPQSMLDNAYSLLDSSTLTANATANASSSLSLFATELVEFASRASIATALLTGSSANDADYNSTANGSHYSGLASVPFDNYLGNLHKGEMVLDATTAASLKRYGIPVRTDDASKQNIIDARPIFAQRETPDNQSQQALLTEIRRLNTTVEQLRNERKDDAKTGHAQNDELINQGSETNAIINQVARNQPREARRYNKTANSRWD